MINIKDTFNYLYYYPLIKNYQTFYLTHKNTTDISFNKLVLEPTYDPTSFASPNIDTVYGYMWLDVSIEPVYIYIPKIKDRYYSVEFCDFFTQVFNYVSLITNPLPEGGWIACHYEYRHPLKFKVDYIIQSPTPICLGLIRIRNYDDPLNIKLYFDQFQIIGYHKQYKYLIWNSNLLNTDYKQVVNLAIKNGWINEISELTINDPTTLSESIKFATKLIQKGLNSYKIGIWNTSFDIDMTPHSIESYQDAINRAAIVDIGIYLNTNNEAIYSVTFDDQYQQPLNGNNQYYIVFQQFPPFLPKGFWSLTLYDPSTKLPIKFNNKNQFINSKSDGVILIQNSDTLNLQQNNILYINNDQSFYIIFRIYLPDLSKLIRNNIVSTEYFPLIYPFKQ